MDWATLSSANTLTATREQVLRWLQDRVYIVYTARHDPKHKSIWDRGDIVEPTKNRLFITTKGNETTTDNLGNLPSIREARDLLG